MIAVDTNLLVYAHREDSLHHSAALESIRDLARASAPWAVPWPCLHEFLAITTHPRVFKPPSPITAALDAVDEISGAARVLSESGDHPQILRRLLARGDVVGPRVHDARIAAICIGHGVRELWTADRDFSWFPELKTRNPLTRA